MSNKKKEESISTPKVGEGGISKEFILTKDESTYLIETLKSIRKVAPRLDINRQQGKKIEGPIDLGLPIHP